MESAPLSPVCPTPTSQPRADDGHRQRTPSWLLLVELLAYGMADLPGADHDCTCFKVDV